MTKTLTCFVCGEEVQGYEAFCQHILDVHEEGKDYIKCPMPHCGCPIRDLNIHLKAKHPQVDPKTVPGQRRALVWHDKGPGRGRRKSKAPKIKTGEFQSIKMGKMMHYRSGLERSVYGILDESHDVMAFSEEPFEINYVFKGKPRRYIPDILVKYIDGSQELWEVKPQNQKDLEINQCKWAAASLQCQARGWRFVVIDEDAIETLKVRVARNIPLRG